MYENDKHRQYNLHLLNSRQMKIFTRNMERRKKENFAKIETIFHRQQVRLRHFLYLQPKSYSNIGSCFK